MLTKTKSLSIAALGTVQVRGTGCLPLFLMLFLSLGRAFDPRLEKEN